MQNKIIFTGPVGAGKTTAISAVSDIAVVGTEARASDDVALRKENTTVAMDYGILSLDGGKKVHLYGTPGQDRFDFMWEILAEGAIGFVILLDSLRADPMADLETYLDAFRNAIKSCGNAVVIGVSRLETGNERSLLPRVQERLEALKLQIPVFEVDTRQREDVKQLLIALLAVLSPAASRSPSAA